MAKQIIILVVSLTLLIFSGIWEINYLNESSAFFMSDIDSVKNAINSSNYESAKNNMDRVEKTWEDMKFVWNIFVNHERIDDLEECMIELKSYVIAKDNEESINSSDRLKRIIEQIVEKQQFTAEHVL